MTMPNQQPERHTKSSLRDSVLEQIAAKNITPTKHWVFMLREIGIWACAVIAVVIGALGLAATLHSLSQSDIAFYAKGPGPLFGFLSSSLPIIWILVLLAMILLTRFQIQHAKNGYRYRFVVMLIVLTTIILGLLFHLLHAGRFIERQLSLHAPRAVECFIPHQAPWQRPEDGVLGGVVTQTDEANELFVIHTIENTDWTIDATEAEIRNKKNDIIVVEPEVSVHMFGTKTGDQTFQADTIRVDDTMTAQRPDSAPCGNPLKKGQRPLPPKPMMQRE